MGKSVLFFFVFLLLDLRSYASNLASQQTNFIGNVPSTCFFSNVEATNEMSWRERWNDFFGRSDFSVTSNSNSIRLSLSKVSSNTEPSNITSGTKLDARLYSSENSVISSSNKSTDGSANTFSVTPGTSEDLNIRIWVETNTSTSGLYHLKPGNYSYSVTVSCLQ